jgi:hypothetical protein
VPRTVVAGPENTFNLATAYDVLTVLFSCNGEDSLINYGPGDVWLSRTGIPPQANNESCLLLKPYAIYNQHGSPIGRQMEWQMLATADNTVISFTVGNLDKWPTE